MVRSSPRRHLSRVSESLHGRGLRGCCQRKKLLNWTEEKSYWGKLYGQRLSCLSMMTKDKMEHHTVAFHAGSTVTVSAKNTGRTLLHTDLCVRGS